MTNPTSNFGWQMPEPTDLVTNLPADFEVFGQAVDTDFADLLGGTTGQVLSKTTGTDLDFTWTTPTDQTPLTTKGDLFTFTTTDARIGVGTTGQILSANPATATGLEWVAANPGDITAVTVTSPITGGGTSGSVGIAIQDGTTAQKGAVQLENSTSSTSTTTAAVPANVKTSYDLAAAAIPKSTVTTNGDLIYGTGSATVTRLGIGSAAQVLTVSGGVPTWATPSAGGGGKVLQVVHATTSTSTSTSSTTPQDTTLTASITPTLNTSKVLVIVSQNGCIRNSGNVDNSLALRLLRGGTSIIAFDVLLGYQAVSGNQIWLTTSTNYLDSPATTSSTTYKTQFSSAVSGQSVTTQGANSISTITLLEIGA